MNSVIVSIVFHRTQIKQQQPHNDCINVVTQFEPVDQIEI